MPRSILLLIALLAFCPRSAAQDAPSPFMLVTPAEIAAVEAAVNARVEAYRAATCPRPVLWGEPEAGSGTEKLLSVVEGWGELHDCLALLDARGEDLALEDLEVFLARGDALEPELYRQLSERCGYFADAVGQAVAPGDLCTPWRPGVRGAPNYTPLLRTSLATVLLGRLSYQPADAMRHVRGGLNRIRFDQDMVRGGGTLITAMIGAASSVGTQLPWLRWLVGRGDLDASDLAEVVEAAGILLESEPPVSDIIEAEGWWGFIQLILPLVKGSDWTPPGGWDQGHVPQGSSPAETLGIETLIDPKTDAAILMVAMDEVRRLQAEACPTGATALACIKGLRDQGTVLRERGEVKPLIRAIRVLASPRTELRLWITDLLMGVAMPDFGRYIERYALRSILLAELRLHAAILEERAKTGHCTEDFSDPYWAPLLDDPIFPGEMSVTLEDSGAVWVIRPAGEIKEPTARDDAVYRFTCPPPHAD